MFCYLKGTCVHKCDTYLALDIGGVGFRVYSSLSTLSSCQLNTDITLYTHTYVREDTFDIFGFSTNEELAFFEKLISVSGVGPRLALAILSTHPAQTLIMAILSNDSKKIAQAPGVGPKLAQRIILELKDKLKDKDVEDAFTQVPAFSSGSSEAVDALMVLGYAESEARKAVSSVESGLTVEETIKKALMHLAG